MCLVLAPQSHETPGRCSQERDLVLSVIHVYMEEKTPKVTSAIPWVRHVHVKTQTQPYRVNDPYRKHCLRQFGDASPVRFLVKSMCWIHVWKSQGGGFSWRACPMLYPKPCSS